MVDGCPECVYNTEAPKSTTPTTDGHRAAYLCADCGHAWTTDWKDDVTHAQVFDSPTLACDNGCEQKDGPDGALTPRPGPRPHHLSERKC